MRRPFGDTVAALGDPAVPFADPAPIGDTVANGDMAAVAAISDMVAVGDMAIVTYKTHAFYPGQNICTLRCEWRGRRGKARQGKATSLLVSLTKTKDPPRSCMSARRPTLARLVAISGQS